MCISKVTHHHIDVHHWSGDIRFAYVTQCVEQIIVLHGHLHALHFVPSPTKYSACTMAKVDAKNASMTRVRNILTVQRGL